MTATARRATSLLAVVGPTGTGKSEVAVGVARALRGEIVGCDALQVYRGLDAATGKPPAEARRSVVHHLVDCADPRADYTMAQYVREADDAIAGIVSRGAVPLVVGGTGLYLRALLRGFIEAPARDPDLRERLHRIVERGGAERLRTWLRRRDPESARRIPAADVQRLVRAVELAGGDRSWSERLRCDGTWSGTDERYRALKVALDLDRMRHDELLDRRVDRFFDAGLVSEVRNLLRSGVPAEANAFKAIGYREVLRALLAGGDPDAVRDEVKRRTRQYARRQRTWFRREAGVTWIDAAVDRGTVVRRIADLWERHADPRPV